MPIFIQARRKYDGQPRMETSIMQDNTGIKPITVTIETALKVSGIGRTKLYQLLGDGTLKSITIGRRRLVIFASLEELAHVA